SRDRAAARARCGARSRAGRAGGAHRAGRRRGAGAHVLARPLASRPQRADAQAGGGAVPRKRACDALGRARREEGQADADARLVTAVSVVIPVKNGERYLEELLAALARERADELLVIDSGSTDRSLEIARAAPGVTLLEIPPHEFGHGRTRNLGAERAHGELICFLTQDATPVPGWLDAVRAGFALDDRVGAVFGPHLPRPDTSPMIARELERHFAGFEA